MAITHHVGTVVPTDDQIAQLLATFKGGYETMLPWGIMLEPEQRSSITKPRSGATEAVGIVQQLAQELGLMIPGMPLENMGADIKVGEAAAQVERQLELALRLASDTRLAAHGEAWQSFLGYYGVLQSMAQRNPTLAERLKPVIDFMAVGSRRQPSTP